MQCVSGEVSPELLATNSVQVGLKSSLGVAIFTLPLPLSSLLVPEGQLEKGDYLQMWRDIQTEHYTDLANIFTSEVGAATSRLAQYNIFSVAQRNVDGRVPPPSPHPSYCRILIRRTSFISVLSYLLV